MAKIYKRLKTSENSRKWVEKMGVKSRKWAEDFRNGWEWVDVCNRVRKRLKKLRTVFKNVKKG